MRTLYIRIIVMTMLIMILSSVMAFLGTNVYYHYYLKPTNDEKITEIAEKTARIFEDIQYEDANQYLTILAEIGYQFYLINQDGSSEMFGDPFREKELSNDTITSVLSGETYHGVADYPWDLFITGFFDNELKNTVGVPIEINDEIAALFVRPNTVQQFGEMRFFLAVLLVLALLFSFILVLTSTRFIVKPIKKLTEATKKIAAGNYHLKLNVNRRDEIGQLADDFTQMSNSLKRTEEMRQEFVSNVSHEIQSPLTSIQGFSQALREEEIPKEMQDHYLSIIEKESRRLSSLSKQLLTLSFLDSDKTEMESVEFNLASQLKEVVATTEWQWRVKEMVIELDIEPFVVTGDPQLLQQVWMNLVTNAIHYSEENGSILIRFQKRKDGIIVSIKDNGIGINKSEVPFLFDRFYRADKARTRTDNSTGLGLSIVKKIIELHNGSITVTSDFGEGSEFIVFLPNNIK